MTLEEAPKEGFLAHSEKQEKALFFETPMGLLACGIQFGKTKVGSVWMSMKNHTYTDPTDNFLIVAPTYKILTQSTLPPFLELMRGRGQFNKADMSMKVTGGGTVYMRSGENPTQSSVSPTFGASGGMKQGCLDSISAKT